MPTLDIYSAQRDKVGEVNLSEEVFGVEVKSYLLHEVVVWQLACRRRGTAKTKTRSEVRGGGKKPWRQKGSGRARVGSSRSPLWRKGGVTFGPKPRDYSFKMHRKVRRQAMRSALTSKLTSDDIIVLDDLDLEAPKTKKMIELLDILKVERKALIVTGCHKPNVYLSARNLQGVSVTFAPLINVYDLLLHDKLILTKEAVAKIEEVYSDA